MLVQIALGVFIGNALTAAFIAACVAMYKKPDNQIPSWAFGCFVFPLLIAAVGIYGFS